MYPASGEAPHSKKGRDLMNKTKFLVAALCSVSATAVTAGGLDRNNLQIDALFEEGNYAEFRFSRTNPDISGTGSGIAVGGFTLLPAGTIYSDVGGSFNNSALAVKLQFTEQFSMLVQVDQPYGSDIVYNGSSATTELGGTSAIADTEALSLIGRYQIDQNWSIHGGARYVRARGDIALGGLAYGRVNGYEVSLEDGNGWGYVIGGAYEMPEIALRVALTYYSAVTHEFDTRENISPVSSTTSTDSPQSINLDFQTGIAEDTLLFGQIRWAQWSEFKIDPVAFKAATGSGLVDLDDSTTYTIGVGRRFTDEFAASIALGYEAGDNDLVSPLAPTDGFTSLSLGGEYEVSEGVTLGGGIRYTWLGDARPETGTPDVERAQFADNNALSIGIRLGVNF